ncbi:MAG TPA: alcohol dehydrogenase catalytic domain-containing protein [Microlunatus sp.]|nr:alcohol dehydrogenase catalytic domain-containing protein [Microlunatus sp.]
MRALVLAEVGRFELVDLPDPRPGPGDVRVRVTQSGICGSELGGFRGTDGLRRPGLVFGHELIGTVDAYGSEVPHGSRLAEGTLVTVNPLRSCMRCRVCRAGRPNVCPQRQLLGGHVNGSNAELVVTDATLLHPVSPERPETAILAEPTACAVRAVGRTAVTEGGSALVIGAGPIGLLLLEVLRLQGVDTLLFTERMPGRVAAAESSGARRIEEDQPAMSEEIRAATDGFGVDAVFDAVGSSQTRHSAVQAVRPGGNVCLVGLHTDESTVAVRDLIRREVTCVTSFAYRPDEFARAVDLLGSGRVRFHGEIVHAGLEAGQSWYEQLIAGHPAGKVVLDPRPATVGAVR